MNDDHKSVIKKYPMVIGYDVMREELPENDLERETLKILAGEGGIMECIELWEKNGYSKKDFDVFYKKAGDWENTHMCVPGSYEEEN